MNFYNQFKDLFEVGKIPFIPTQRLKLDNQLFIDRPYMPTYKQQYSLNSKLRQLNKDYNQFQYQVKQLEQLEDIPKRSQSRRKAYHNENQQKNNIVSTRNQHTHKKNKSSIFNSYQQNASQYFPNKNMQRPQKPVFNNQSPALSKDKSAQFSKDKPIQQNRMNQKQNKLNNLKNRQYDYQQQNVSPEKQLLQSLRKQNQENTSRLLKNQNLLKNKFYQEENNNVLKQSQINHVFNWKLQKPSTFDRLQNLPETTIPKYKLQSNLVENERSFENNNGHQKNFAIRNRSNHQLSNNRNKIVPQQKQFNQMNKNSNAMQRRRIAQQNIDQRRQKLKVIIKSYY